MESKKKNLIAALYSSIVEDTPVRTPDREILLTTTAMDSIFVQPIDEENSNGKRRTRWDCSCLPKAEIQPARRTPLCPMKLEKPSLR